MIDDKQQQQKRWIFLMKGSEDSDGALGNFGLHHLLEVRAACCTNNISKNKTKGTRLPSIKTITNHPGWSQGEAFPTESIAQFLLELNLPTHFRQLVDSFTINQNYYEITRTSQFVVTETKRTIN